jgi:hypothetical protein
MTQRSGIEEMPLRRRPQFEALVARLNAGQAKPRDQLGTMHASQLDHVDRMLQARENKTKSLVVRRKWMERQANANYRNEYDRIRGELSHNKLGSVDRQKLKNREAELEKLFSRNSVYST